MMLMLTCDSLFSNQFIQLGSLACTTILSSSEGRQSIAKGWKKAGVTDIVSGSKKLPPEDSIDDLDV